MKHKPEKHDPSPEVHPIKGMHLLVKVVQDHQLDPEEVAADLCDGGVPSMRKRKDGAYEERNRVVALVAKLALERGWRAGRTKTAIEGWDEKWHGCVYIALPTGQVSWHYHDDHAHLFADLPEWPAAWDGHTTQQKYERIEAYVRGEFDD